MRGGDQQFGTWRVAEGGTRFERVKNLLRRPICSRRTK